MTTRCKFVCVSKREYVGWTGGRLFEYEFNVVTGDSPDNKAFFEATPSGSLKVSTVKVDSFEVGKPYFLDLTQV